MLYAGDMPAAPCRAHQCGRVSVTAPPAGLPLDLETEVKPHLRVEHDDEDDLIELCVAAAVQQLDTPDGWLGRSLVSRTLRLTLDAPPPDVIRLPGPPVTAISSVAYRDQDDEFVTIDSADYLSDLTAAPALLWPGDAGWPPMKGGPDTMRITYVAGYASAAAVPKVIKQWLLIRTADLYRDRESLVLGASVAPVSHIDRMLDNWRVR